VSAPGKPDLLLRLLRPLPTSHDDMPLASPTPNGQQTADTWMIVGPSSVVDYRFRRLYGMLMFARKGFGVDSPTLRKYNRGDDGRDSAASKRLHDQDRYERFRQKVRSLHGIAHNQLCKAAPRAFASKFLTWCFETYLPNALTRFTSSIEDPSPYFDGAAERLKRKQLEERRRTLFLIEEKLMSPSAIHELTAANGAAD